MSASVSGGERCARWQRMLRVRQSVRGERRRRVMREYAVTVRATPHYRQYVDEFD